MSPEVLLPTAVEKMLIVFQTPESLRPFGTNARTHSKAQIRKIADSIRTFGFTNPILVDKSDTIIAGHGRVEAAKLLGIEQVPTIRLESLTPAQVRAYVIADNRLAEDAGWDEQILKIELQNLIIDDSIDVSCTGFETSEIDLILSEAPPEEYSEEDLDQSTGVAVSRQGDLWQLGTHRIMCGDAREEAALSQLMSAERAAIVFTDPPYNVVIHGHATGHGKTHHPEFAMASGEMTEKEFKEFLLASLAKLADWSMNGSVHYICMDWRHMSELLAAGKQTYNSLLNVCVWAKDNGGMGSFYRSQHELIFVFRNGNAQHRNNIQLGKFGRYRTNVWQYPGANTLSRSGTEGNLLSMHPTVKPIALAADALLDASARGEIVLDTFLGAGTTLLAAERVGRSCRGLEIEPKYVDLAIRRWQTLTGEQAVHAGARLTFGEMEAERSLSHVG